MSALSDALNRLVTGYYNSNPIDAVTNPGGLGNDGHEVNFPAALSDYGLVVQYLAAINGNDLVALSVALAQKTLSNVLDSDLFPRLPPGIRNRLHNPDMRVDQRNVGAVLAGITNTSSKPTVDRWRVGVPSSVTLSAQRAAIAWAITPTLTGLRLITTATVGALAAGDVVQGYQVTEGVDIADWAWGTAAAKSVSLQLKVLVNVAGDYGISLTNAGGTHSYVTKVTLVATTPTTVTLTIPGPTVGAWAADNSAGVIVRLCLGCGATYKTATLGAWQAGNFFGPTTQTNQTATVNALTIFTDVQIEDGSPTLFERLPFFLQLARCLPYYEKSYALATAPGAAATAGRTLISKNPIDAAFYGTIPFKVRKRGTPTVRGWDTTGAAISSLVASETNIDVNLGASASLLAVQYDADAEP